MGFDFYADITEILKSQYQLLGLKFPAKAGLDKQLLDYYTVIRKMILPLPRKVDFSPPLRDALPRHPQGLEILTIAKGLREGRNINRFQSKRLPQTNFHDHLQYEWNIHHLHLSLDLQKDGRVKQGNQLLFVYIENKRAILLGTDTHREGIFADHKWQEILYDFFPDVLEPLLQKGVTNVSPNLTAAERQVLWDKGYTIGMYKIRDRVFWSPGIGRGVSGHSMIVTKQVNNTVHWLHTITKQFEKYATALSADIGVANPQFSIRVREPSLEVYETVSNQRILTFPEQLNEDYYRIR